MYQIELVTSYKDFKVIKVTYTTCQTHHHASITSSYHLSCAKFHFFIPSARYTPPRLQLQHRKSLFTRAIVVQFSVNCWYDRVGELGLDFEAVAGQRPNSCARVVTSQ